MTKPLRACVDCGRHIRIAETTCPFCNAALPDAFHTPPVRGRSAGLLGRAAALVIGATTAAVGLGAAAAMTGCSDADDAPLLYSDAYGVPFDAKKDVLLVGDAYGLPADHFAPPPDDGGTDAKDGAVDGDAATTDGSADGGAD